MPNNEQQPCRTRADVVVRYLRQIIKGIEDGRFIDPTYHTDDATVKNIGPYSATVRWKKPTDRD